MKEIFLYFLLAVIFTMQIFIFYEINRIENMLVLTIAGIPLTQEVQSHERNISKRTGTN